MRRLQARCKRAAVSGVLLLLFAGLAGPPSRAEEPRPEEPAGEPTYLGNAGRKLTRGAANAALGWWELPAGIQNVGEKHGVGAAATWGVVHGAGRFVQRTAVGIFEIFTFPFGLPQDFKPLIEPEFVFQGDEEKAP